MTRQARRTTTPAPPLAERIRAAITSAEWRSLSELDALTTTRAASDQRRAVHAALRELRAGGAVLEERVGAGGVEVRVARPETPDQSMEAVREELAAAPPPAPTMPAPVPDDGHGGGLAIDAAPTPGPGARCASCDAPFARHATAYHPFAPKRREELPAPEEQAQMASDVEAARAEPAVRAAPCTPPACEWLRINEPSRVPEERLPPLCEGHRARWRAARGGGQQATRGEVGQ